MFLVPAPTNKSSVFHYVSLSLSPRPVLPPSSCLLTCRTSVRRAESPLRNHLSDLAMEWKGRVGKKINSRELARPSHWAQLCPRQNQINTVKIKRKEGTEQGRSLIRAQLGNLKSISALSCWHSASGRWWSDFLCAHAKWFLLFYFYFSTLCNFSKYSLSTRADSDHRKTPRILGAMFWVYNYSDWLLKATRSLLSLRGRPGARK